MYLPRASVTYRLVAYVHRPGTFTARLQSIQEVRIVACPSLSDADEGGGHQEEGVVVDREWEDQLRYRIELDRKKMEIGSDLKLKMTVMPLEKVKIWRISAYLGEQVEYLTKCKTTVAKETPVLFELWNLKQDESEGRKEETQLLPIVSDSDDALLSSPLLEYMVPTEYNSAMQDAEGSSSTVDMDAATDFLGPGPWKLAHTMPLPHCDLVVPSFTNPAGGIGRANMEVKHTVKIVMRVERGDDKHLDKKGRRKRWDIVVQIGVQMLACQCAGRWNTLPRYSLADPVKTNVKMHDPTCLCKPGGFTKRNYFQHPLTAPPNVMRNRRPSSVEDTQRNIADRLQYERLVAGRERDSGEVPPAYGA